MAVGAAWMVLFKLAERGLGVVSTIVLARLLVPQDFGLVAIAMSLVAVLELMGAFSFDIALIQNRNAERRHYDTVWTFNALFSAFCALVLLVLAKPAAQFYHDHRLENINYVLAFATLVGGFENIGLVFFRKELTFAKEFRFLLGKRLVGFFVTIPLAFTLESYWALVAGIVAMKAAGVMLSYYAHPYRPCFSLAACAELFHFSKWLFINNVLFFLRYRSSDFVIGRIAGAHALGMYNLSLEIASLPTNELVMPINRAVFPGYAKLAKTLAVLRAGYLEVLAAIAMFILPAGVGVALTADFFVPVILGPNWSGLIPVVQLLAISSTLVALQTNNGNIYLALGSPRTLTALALLSVTIFVPLVIWLTRENGATGAAWGNLAAVLLMLPINLSVLFRKLELKAPQFLRAIWRPLVSTLGMVGVVLYIKHSILVHWLFLGTMAQLLLVCIAGAVAYSVFIGLLWQLSGRPAGAERYVVNRLAHYRSRRMAGTST